MALAAITTWEDGDTLTGDDLTNEFGNILANPISLISPLAAGIDANGQHIINLGSIDLVDNSAPPSTLGQFVIDDGIFKGHDGSQVRFNQVIHSVSQSGVISSTASETALYTFSVPAGYLGTLNKIVTTIKLRIGLLDASSVVVKCYYAGEAGPALTVVNTSGVTAGMTICPLTVTLAANATTQDQVLMSELHTTSTQTNLADAFASTRTNLAQAIDLEGDSTSAQNLQVNVIFSSSSASNQCDYLSLQTVLMG